MFIKHCVYGLKKEETDGVKNCSYTICGKLCAWFILKVC